MGRAGVLLGRYARWQGGRQTWLSCPWSDGPPAHACHRAQRARHDARFTHALSVAARHRHRSRRPVRADRLRAWTRHPHPWHGAPVMTVVPYGEVAKWQPDAPRLRPVRLLIAWAVSAAAVWITSWLLPGVTLEATGAAFAMALALAILNALLPPVLAALRLPFMVG